MNNFEKIFTDLARQDDPNIIFNNWLDYVIDINLFTNKKREMDFRSHEKEYYEMYKAWVTLQDEYFRNNPDKYWYDYLGLFYEDIIQSKYKAGTRGQFFTPSDVCDAMARLSLSHNPIEHYDGQLINDCASGSGRLLLACKEYAPNAVFVACDLDSVAVKMCTLNFYIHGVRGAVICKNTLSGEFYGAYRVNNYLGYGLPLPHIELCSSESEALNLFGVKREDMVCVDSSSNDKDTESIKSTKQITLI